MDKQMIKRMFEVLGEEYSSNFEKYKIEECTLKYYTAIPFFSRTVHTRKISDWGTDEDEDVYLLYFEDGWKFCTMTVQVGGGVQKVVNNALNTQTTDQIAEWFEKQEIIDQMKMIANAYEVIKSAQKLDRLLDGKHYYKGEVREIF